MISDLWQNEICFKLRYRVIIFFNKLFNYFNKESNHMSETEFSKSANPLHKIEDQITHYNWYEDENNSNTLVLTKQVI